MGVRTQKTCRDSLKTSIIDKTGTTRNSQEKDRTAAPTNKANNGNCIIRRRADIKTNKYEFSTKFITGDIKLFATNWKNLTSDKYILDIVTNKLRLDFK